MNSNDELEVNLDDELRPEYDAEMIKEWLKTGVRGKYAGQSHERTNIVRIAPDVSAIYPNEEAVNAALRKQAALDAVMA